MNAESIREYCLSLPHVTEVVQWGEHLVLKVGGKIFAIVALEPQDDVVLSFKTAPEQFYELQEWPGILPAPYLARSQWLALERFDVLRDDELKQLLATAHRLIYEKLPKRTKEELASDAHRRGKKVPRSSDLGNRKKGKDSSSPRRRTAKKARH